MNQTNQPDSGPVQSACKENSCCATHAKHISNPWRNRLFVVFIALLTFGPFTLAWYISKHPEWLASRSNYGELIIPPRPTSYAGLAIDPSAANLPLTELNRRWVLLQLAPQGRCDAVCQEALHRSKQVWLRLSKDLPRVRRLLLTSGETLDTSTAASIRQNDETLLIAKSTAELEQLLIEQAAKTNPGATLWLIDPLGNVMMRYSLDYDPHGLLRDLQHLLKISTVG